jgi:hypothetical protein
MRFNTKMTTKLKIASVVAALTLCLGATSSAFAAPTASLTAGSTAVNLDAGFTGALSSLGVALGTLPRTQVRNGAVAFPIVTGAIDLSNAKSEITHAGGISLTAGGTRVELSDFVIETFDAKPVLTGIVVLNDSIVDRIPLFDLVLPAGLTVPLRPIGGRVLDLPGVGVKLNATAAATLNSVFNVSAFAGGFNIGVASVRAITIREH